MPWNTRRAYENQVRNISALSSLGVNPNVRTTPRHVPALSSLGVNPNVRKTSTTNAPVSSGGRDRSDRNDGVDPGGDAPRRSRRSRPSDWRDSAYNAQIAAINRALRDHETGLQTRTQRYGEDFTRGKRDLGFRAGEDFDATPDILGFRDLSEGLAAVRRPQRPMARGLAEGEEPEQMSAAETMGGTWDLEGEYNPFSSAARGTRSSRDDFAGRGTLRSSDFAQSFAQFQDRLNQQLESMETGRGRFYEDSLTNLAQQRSSAQERRASAQRDAMMRAATRDAGR